MTGDDLEVVRGLLLAAFPGNFDQHHWENCLGGRHVLGFEAETLIAHAAIVPRRISIDGRTHVVAYVESVAVAPDLQGRGIGPTLMAHVGAEIDRTGEIGVLASARHRFYERCGWSAWSGPLSAEGPNGESIPTPAAAGVIFVRGVTSTATTTLQCDYRPHHQW